jgi:hypothetical protein
MPRNNRHTSSLEEEDAAWNPVTWWKEVFHHWSQAQNLKLTRNQKSYQAHIYFLGVFKVKKPNINPPYHMKSFNT